VVLKGVRLGEGGHGGGGSNALCNSSLDPSCNGHSSQRFEPVLLAGFIWDGVPLKHNFHEDRVWKRLVTILYVKLFTGYSTGAQTAVGVAPCDRTWRLERQEEG